MCKFLNNFSSLQKPKTFIRKVLTYSIVCITKLLKIRRYLKNSLTVNKL
jgi:hypothetical protein